MGRLDRFRRKSKKEEQKTTVTTPTAISKLEELCGADKETCAALYNAMMLDPKKCDMTMKDAAENAKKFEKERDYVKAGVLYRIAGGLAIYEGNAKKVIEYFSEAERLQPKEKFPILKNPEKAVDKAQEYYKTYMHA